MRLTHPFLKLPLEFDAAELEREVRALPEIAWVPHPTGFEGNEAVRLVTAGGRPTDDLDGEMAPTPELRAMPYAQQIMSEIGGVSGPQPVDGSAGRRRSAAACRQPLLLAHALAHPHPDHHQPPGTLQLRP